MLRLAILILGLFLGPAHADQRDGRLPDLFARLKAAPDVATAEPLEARIWTIWSEAPDPGSAALLAAGTAAMGQRAWPTALALLDRLVVTRPEFAEAWNKRATLLYLMGEHARSVADIQKTLALEPRHFGALSGLGLIHEARGDKAAALEWYRKALAQNPHMPGIVERVDVLTLEVEGEPI